MAVQGVQGVQGGKKSFFETLPADVGLLGLLEILALFLSRPS